ncbi:uncharacterized protein LOC127038419 isoform X3 [Gopherus flavomarginatus]|uniref:uncharacterized protein LOC127038419 isoform X3 n=1 Tax=Gopherus flavomarginatus TaxID=286002 RepID=UPI0021CC3AE3|nr:uncharacterized protein LOC127038419 isoform X3 [Gopherus flavomarginatus]
MFLKINFITLIIQFNIYNKNGDWIQNLQLLSDCHKTAYQVKLTQIDSFKTDLMKSRRSRPDIIIMPKESEEELLTSHVHQSNEEVNEMMSKILGDLEPTELIPRKQLPLKVSGPNSGTAK